MDRADCVFCQIIDGQSPAEFVFRSSGVVVFRPLNPVTPGHLLVVPTRHVLDASTDPVLTGEVMATAARLARKPYNLITSAGRAATQTIDHLHIHVVPRRANDGLTLPWTDRGW